MFRRLREFGMTLRGLAHVVGAFFRRWFLPLHSDDEDDEAEETGREGRGLLGWSWEDLDDDDYPRRGGRSLDDDQPVGDDTTPTRREP